MNKIVGTILVLLFLLSCSKEDSIDNSKVDNPVIALNIPSDFPVLNSLVMNNQPTKYGVLLGEKLFHEQRFSTNNTISCASCHQQSNAFSDNNAQAIGIYGRVGLRNVPPIQNMAFMKFFNWDGSKLKLETQPIVPIITHEEMNSSILEVIGKIQNDTAYKSLFKNTFGNDSITPDRIYQSLAQYEFTLISANSKYDKVKRKEGFTFSDIETVGYQIFKDKCASCHSTELFTDQTFRNVGFPLNPSIDEAGRARVTGISTDYMRFRVPSLRNAAFTAPYGSFGQFLTIKSVLDYFSNGVIASDNLDPILKNNGNKISMTEQEKQQLIAFINTLSDSTFIQKKN